MKMDLERIGGRSRAKGDGNATFAAESEALDQIAKEVRELKQHCSIKC